MILIEDKENLSPLGNTICTSIFGLGVILLSSLLLIAGNLPQKIKIIQSKEVEKSIYRSKPEELALIISFPVAPQIEDEQTQRQVDLETKLEEIEKRLRLKIPASSPKELIKNCVKAGTIHPLDAESFLRECNIFSAKKIGGIWTTEKPLKK